MKKMRWIASLILIIICFANMAFADGLRFYQQETANKSNGRIMQYLSDISCFWNEYWVEFDAGELLPVYAYPSEDAWRGANGKACVDAGSGFTLLAWTDDEQWLLIDYETNKGHRVGYIRVPEGLHMGGSPEYLMHVPMQLASDTFVTDDPNGTQQPIAHIKAGETVDVLGYTDAYWAFVQLEIEGKAARAFMPLGHLKMPEETVNEEVMAALQGTWSFIGGAELLGYGAIFDGKGNVQICDTEDYENLPPTELIIRKESMPLEYCVYENALGDKRYPCPYVLEVESETHFIRYGLSLEVWENGWETFSLIQAEAGGGGYKRTEEVPVVRE